MASLEHDGPKSQAALRSGLLLALPVVMLLSAVLSWWSFKAYPSNLFGEGDEDIDELGHVAFSKSLIQRAVVSLCDV